MIKTRKLAPIAIGLACTAALLGAVAYQDLSLRSRATMERHVQIESATDAIAAKLGQSLNVRFIIARALAAHIVSQDFSQNATPAVDSGRFANLMIQDHGVVKALLTFSAESNLSSTATDAKIPESLLHGLEATASDPLSKAVRLPMGSWELATVPRDGWRQASWVLTIFNILGVLMAGLVGLSAYFLTRQLAKLRLTIDSVTHELRAQKDELTIAQSRLVDAIERIPEGIALCDGAGDRVTANRRDDRSEPFETSPGRGEVERHERQPTEAKEQAEVAETPIVEGPGEAGEVVVPLPGPGAVRSEVRILIAEDNPSNQMVIKHFLEMSGYRSDVANNGLEAVRAAETRAYDLVLMDISMPEMDGITAAAEIRDLARTWDTAPIIVAVTAHALPGDRKRFLAAGFDEVLVKPLRKRELLRGLSKWLSVAPPTLESPRGLDGS